MEPRPGPPRHDAVPGAPLQVGDLVTYCGPVPAYYQQRQRGTPDYRVAGIVTSIRPLCPQAPCDCDWRVSVQWPLIQKLTWRSQGNSKSANYHAKNLRLVRRAPTQDEGWTGVLGDTTVPLRPDEV